MPNRITPFVRVAEERGCHPRSSRRLRRELSVWSSLSTGTRTACQATGYQPQARPGPWGDGRTTGKTTSAWLRGGDQSHRDGVVFVVENPGYILPEPRKSAAAMHTRTRRTLGFVLLNQRSVFRLYCLHKAINRRTYSLSVGHDDYELTHAMSSELAAPSHGRTAMPCTTAMPLHGRSMHQASNRMRSS